MAKLVLLGILVFGAFRGIEIGRVLVNSVFRRRAYWTSIVLLFFAFTSLLNLTQFFGAPPPQNPFIAELFVLPWILEFLLFFIFINSTILATMQMDFFHRDILHWRRAQKPILVTFLVSDICGFTGAIYAASGSPSVWLSVLFYGGIGVMLALLAWSVPLLLVGALRTPDRSMRRFVTFLGMTMVFYLVNLGLQGFVDPLVSNLTSIVPAYFIYRAVMSLSPVGRVQKDIQTRAPGEALASSGLSPLRCCRSAAKKQGPRRNHIWRSFFHFASGLLSASICFAHTWIEGERFRRRS